MQSTGCVSRRDQEPRCERRPHARLRRPEGPARRGRDRLAADDRADLLGPPAAERFPLCRPPGLDKIGKLLKPVYAVATEEAALERFAELAHAWGWKYPAIGQGPRTPPQRTGRVEVCPYGDHVPRPHRQGDKPAGLCVGRQR